MALHNTTAKVDSLQNPQSRASKVGHDISVVETKILPVEVRPDSGAAIPAASIDAAVAELRAGRAVAFPTETVYGLGAVATSSAAVRSIYAAKDRPADNPLIVHFGSDEQLRCTVDPKWPSSTQPDPIPQIYHPLIERFWPGPLTILLPLPSPSPFAPEVTHTLHTFGARIPASPIALHLLQHSSLPLAAPSANRSGRPSPTTAQHVLEDMAGRIRVILDGGPCDVGVESTVIDGLCDPPCVLRPGGVGIEDLRQHPGWENVVNAYAGTEDHRQAPDGNTNCCNGIQEANEAILDTHQVPHISSPTHLSPVSDAAPRAPGMKYRHYAPRAHVVLVDTKAWSRVDELIAAAVRSEQTKIGVLRTRSTKSDHPREAKNSPALPVSNIEDLAIGPTVRQIARGLFAALRELDSRGVSIIFVEGLDTSDEEGEAVMNRLRKAAGDQIRG